ncbi:Heterokaryon incompatibility protein (HET) domain containing protein [Rhypophila decipiens]
MKMSTGFCYSPLNEDLKEIRLLEITPAADRSLPLECTIRHVPLKSARYRCLSYAWGNTDIDIKSRISINYKRPILERLGLKSKQTSPKYDTYQVEIGSSLAAAFMHLRRKHSRVAIWADALCIDQEDKHQEKAWQIDLMKDIYSGAISVEAWLGPRYDDDPNVVKAISEAFGLVSTAGILLRKHIYLDWLQDETSWLDACFALANPGQQKGSINGTTWTTISERLRDALRSKGVWDRYCRAFNILSQVVYFQRVWIIQETARAQYLIFNYADHRASYKDLFLSLCLARPFCMASGFDSRYLSCLTARMTCNQNSDITDVLKIAYTQRPPLHQATKSHDLIYAILGLAENNGGIIADGGVEYAFTKATEVLLQHHDGFTDILLSFKPYIVSEVITSEVEFPSWAFDWTTRGRVSSFGTYKACGNSKPSVEFTQLLGSYKQAMRLKGRICGQVTMVDDSFSAVAVAAGIGQEVIRTGNINLQPTSLSAEEQARTPELLEEADLRRKYQQNLNVEQIVRDTEMIMAESRAAIGPFGLWWLRWVIGVRSLAMIDWRQTREEEVRTVLELIFQDTHTTGMPRELDDLINPSFWSILDSGMSAGRQEQTQPDPRNTTAARPSATTLQLSPRVQSAFRLAHGMRPLALDGSFLAYGPESTEVGDEVVVFAGVKAPLVLRKVHVPADTAQHSRLSSYQCHKIIGPAYVCGVMQGELFDEASAENSVQQPETETYFII